ncbi:PucR family transcriptional regulator [Vagococcus fluvialis]|uniref:PucR family transcriptional regulator n=1 Tax=Vagococcus fluvialis TaxID=2738 RepID=UPI003D151025
MTITIKDVLSLDGFEHALLLAGEKSLDNEVRKATLMEVPDIFPFLEAKSFILTTLYPINSDKKAIDELIPRLLQSDATGLCIKVGRYIDKIPEKMITQAQELNFPLIELHGSDNLSSLAMDIMSISLDEHINQISFLNSVHYQLMKLFLKGHDIDSLVNEFSRLIQAPVILLDSTYNILATSPTLKESKIEVQTELPYHGNSLVSIEIDENSYLPHDLLVHSIEASKRIFGYLILLQPESTNKNLMMVVEEASLLLATAFYKNYAVAEKERNFQDSFVRDLLQGTEISQMDALHTAKLYGWELEFPQILLVLKVYSSNASLVRATYEELITQSTIQKLISRKLFTSPNKIMLTFLDDSLVIFVNSAFIDDSKKKMKEIGQFILEILSPEYDVGIGISSPILDTKNIPQAYGEAQTSLRIGRKLETNSFISHIEDNLIYSVLREIKNQDILEKFVDSILGEVIQHDKEHNSQLLETLYVLIQTGFNLKEAAVKLFIHYNTLRYRVNRLKDLGIDIRKELRIADVTVAYHIYLWIEASRQSED